MDYSALNIRERAFFEQDFYPVWELLKRVRHSLVHRDSVVSGNINLKNILDFVPNSTQIYITLFQKGLKPLRWGSCRNTLDDTLNRIVNKITSLPAFKEFNADDTGKCRILIEYVTERIPVKLTDIQCTAFTQSRFEPGITGFELTLDGVKIYYMPTDAWINSQLDLKSALNTMLRKTYIKDLTDKISERIDILSNTPHEINIIKSRTFITFEEKLLPLYRGNILYRYSADTIRDMALDGADWILNNQADNGKFLPYYDAKEDNCTDCEFSDNVSKLNHCCGVISMTEAYRLTKNEKYLAGAKKGLDFIVSLTAEQGYNGETAGYIFYNEAEDFSETGMALIAMMKYRIETGDRSYDEYIRKYIRYLLPKIHEYGKTYDYNFKCDKNQRIIMPDAEWEKQSKALFGLALYVTSFDDNDTLKHKVSENIKFALSMIINENSKIYSNLYSGVHFDAWLMQAIEELSVNPEFREQKLFDIVFNDIQSVMNKMYTADNSPYIDYEGAFFCNYGDYYCPDGFCSEGLIAAYCLAKKLGYEEKAKEILQVCKLSAKSLMFLCNNEYNSYAHKNPGKSEGSVRYKTIKQIVRADIMQQVICFYLRLYRAVKG